MKILLSSKKELLLTESGIPRMAVCGVKVGNIKVFRKHWTKSDHKELHSHIYKTYEAVFRINYRKNTVEMTLFQKYKVFINI